MKWALKNEVVFPNSGPSGVSNAGCFHYVADDRVIFSTLKSAPTANVCPALLSPLGCLLEEEGMVFTLKKPREVKLVIPEASEYIALCWSLCCMA